MSANSSLVLLVLCLQLYITIAGRYPPVDLTLVLDTTFLSEIELDIYKDALRDCIKEIGVEDKGNRIALVTFDNEVRVVFDLEHGLTLESTLKSLEEISSKAEAESKRRTADALAIVSDEVYNGRESGDREGGLKIVILITTGASESLSSTVTEANRLKRDNTTVFVIGIGQWLCDAEIQFIATKPASYYSTRIKTVSQLNSTLFEMVSKQREMDDEPKVLECAPLFDLTIIMDASKSLSEKNFQRQKDFVDKLVSSFDISPKTTRISLITYSSISKIIFNLHTYTSYTPMSAAIQTVQQTGTGRKLDKAMRYARNAVFWKRRVDQDGVPVPQILIILAGGKTQFVDKSISEGNILKDLGVTIFTINGGRRKQWEMTKMASEPIVRYNFNIRSFRMLPKIYHNMVDTTCRDIARVTTTSLQEHFDIGQPLPAEECSGESDVLFIFQIPPSNGDWRTLRLYLQRVIKYLKIGKDEIRVGLVAYVGTFITLIPLEANANQNNTLKTLSYLNPKHLLSVEGKESIRFGEDLKWRDNVVKIVVMVFLGDENNAVSEKTLNDLLYTSNRQDTVRFVINLGTPRPNLANLLASEPKSNNVIYSPFLDNLMTTIPNIVNSICDDSGFICKMAAAENKLEGLGSVQITTDDLDTSIEFYTEILGGKLLETWSLDFCGEGHAERIFGYELNQARLQGVDPWTLGVPEISKKNNVQVQWRFIMFDNFLLKLVQYQAHSGEAISLREELTSPAICPNPHLCLWVGDTDINKYIRAVENEVSNRNIKTVYFNRPLPVETEEDRAGVPEDKLSNRADDGEFAPLAMVFFKGPTGEQLEMFQTYGSLTERWRNMLSALAVPSIAFLQGHTDYPGKTHIGITAQLFGMNHFGVRVKDMKRCVQFYCDVLGGNLLPLKGDFLQGDAMRNVLFEKEILLAKTLGKSLDAFGIPDVSYSGNVWVNVRFIQFGTATLELVEYCMGDRNNPEPYAPCFDWTSPAYVNTMTLSLAVRDGVNFREFLNEITTEAKSLGFPEFYVNTPLNDQTELFKGQEIEGYNYAMAKGPSGENLACSQFSGKCRENLHSEIQKYHGVSTLFPDLNPLKS